MSAADFVRQFWDEIKEIDVVGHIGKNESALLVELIERHKPKVFVEIGTASGFSTKLIARCMSKHGGERLFSFDISQAWYVDTTKPVGFMTAELRESGFPVDIAIVTGSTSADIQSELSGLRVDAAFIDGNHYHPWPTLDTMLLLPRMRSGGFVALHDLHLYMIGNCSGPGHGVTAGGGSAITSWIAWRADFPLSLPVAMTEAAAA